MHPRQSSSLLCVAEADPLASTVMLLSTCWDNGPVPPHLMPVTVSAHRLLSFACFAISKIFIYYIFIVYLLYKLSHLV